MTLWRVFWRSLFLQAAWNPKGMQNLGFAYALYPVLARLYPEPERLNAATERHLSCFNSHPYAAAAILGGAIYHEERIARGEQEPGSVNTFKQALMGPFAALGDGFFWLSLRPAVGAMSALLTVLFGLWGPLFYLVSYNAVHLGVRARFFLAGRRLGDGVVSVVAASRLPFFGERLRVLAAICVGGAAGVYALAPPVSGVPSPWAQLGGGAVFVACYALLTKGASPYVLAYLVMTLAVIGGLVL